MNVQQHHDGSEFRSQRPLRLAPSERSPLSWKIWYDDLLEYFLTNPGTTITAAAEYVGRNMAWVSMLVRSDSFQAALAKRRDERMGEINAAVGDRLTRVALTALEVLDEKLSKHRTNIPIEKVTEAVDVTLERLGYGKKPDPVATQANVQINIGADPSAVAAARASLRAAEQAKLIDWSEGPPRPTLPPAIREANEVEAAPGPVGSTDARALAPTAPFSDQRNSTDPLDEDELA